MNRNMNRKMNSFKELNIGSKIRIKDRTVWKGVWTVKKVFYEYLEVVRIRSNGRKWTRVINYSDIVEILFNPSRRLN